MKIYLFNPETGIYCGECLSAETAPINDTIVTPLGVTAITPPQGGPGHIMVFNVIAQRWMVHSHWKQEDLDEGD
jgi:hypothetical protein